MYIMKEQEYQTYSWWLTHQDCVKIFPLVKKELPPQLTIESLPINCIMLRRTCYLNLMIRAYQ